MSKRFGTLSVLSGLDMRVEAGEALGIIGPNGAGKSTLLAVMSGAERATEGQILFGGDDITNRRAEWRARNGIAVSYQIPRPFSGMSVFENVLVSATFAGNTRGSTAHRHAVEALLLTGLTDAANATAGSLRLLDRKRLEVARALAANPRLLLLDEIAGGLTEAEVPELVELVRQVLDAGVTVVWIEHVVHALTAVATRMMCLTYGEILAEGAPGDVLEDPKVKAVYLGIDPEEENVA